MLIGWPLLLMLISMETGCWARSVAHQPGNVMLHDICTQNPYGTKRFFLDQGQNGTLIAKNLDYDRIATFSAHLRYSPPFFGQQSGLGNNNNRVCSVELTTCPSCSIQMQFKILNLPKCELNVSKCSGCDHLAIKENYYATPWVICGSNSRTALQQRMQYHSVGRSLTFSFVFSRSYEYAFMLEFASVVNTRLITGRSESVGVISSPHFPTVYPQDYSNEVQLLNLDYADSTSSGFIQLIFDDYALAPMSYIEVIDGNGTKQQLRGNDFFRPPVLLIQGSRITIRFFANGGRASGYRATYKFINDSSGLVETPATDCGGLVDDSGGVITMSNMSAPDVPRLYDCIWLVKPLLESAIRTHLLVRVEQLSDIEAGTTVDFRQGLTSQSPLIETVNSASSSTSSTEYMVPSDIGFYIRLRGHLGNQFKIALAYSAFGYTECYTVKDFMCLNHRCISSDLRCDGFNHCGDNSDEQTACGNQIMTPQDPLWWITHTPKYYFPKMHDYGDYNGTTFILLCATLGVVIFIACILALLYRMSAHSHVLRERQARMDLIRSQLVDSDDGDTGEPENPPCYEPPPDYAEIGKIAELTKAMESNAAPEEPLKEELPPSASPAPVPAPSTKRRRDPNKHSRGLLTPDDALSVASVNSSCSSTPARSRNSTNPHRRVRKSSAHVAVPVHLPAQQTSRVAAGFPNSPPPPYEINISPPFLISSGEGPAQEEMQPDAVDQPTIGCNCAGACGCANPPFAEEAPIEAVQPLFASLSPCSSQLDAECTLQAVSESSGYMASINEEHQRTLSFEGDQQTARQADFGLDGKSKASHQLSIDRVTPTLGQLKQTMWNKSM